MENYTQSNKDPKSKYCSILLATEMLEMIRSQDNPLFYDLKVVMINTIYHYFQIIEIKNKCYQIQLIGKESISFSTEFSYNIDYLFKEIDYYIQSIPLHQDFENSILGELKQLDVGYVRFYMKD